MSAMDNLRKLDQLRATQLVFKRNPTYSMYSPQPDGTFVNILTGTVLNNIDEVRIEAATYGVVDFRVFNPQSRLIETKSGADALMNQVEAINTFLADPSSADKLNKIGLGRLAGQKIQGGYVQFNWKANADIRDSVLSGDSVYRDKFPGIVNITDEGLQVFTLFSHGEAIGGPSLFGGGALSAREHAMLRAAAGIPVFQEGYVEKVFKQIGNAVRASGPEKETLLQKVGSSITKAPKRLKSEISPRDVSLGNKIIEQILEQMGGTSNVDNVVHSWDPGSLLIRMAGGEKAAGLDYFLMESTATNETDAMNLLKRIGGIIVDGPYGDDQLQKNIGNLFEKEIKTVVNQARAQAMQRGVSFDQIDYISLLKERIDSGEALSGIDDETARFYREMVEDRLADNLSTIADGSFWTTRSFDDIALSIKQEQLRSLMLISPENLSEDQLDEIGYLTKEIESLEERIAGTNRRQDPTRGGFGRGHLKGEGGTASFKQVTGFTEREAREIVNRIKREGIDAFTELDEGQQYRLLQLESALDKFERTAVLAPVETLKAETGSDLTKYIAYNVAKSHNKTVMMEPMELMVSPRTFTDPAFLEAQANEISNALSGMDAVIETGRVPEEVMGELRKEAKYLGLDFDDPFFDSGKYYGMEIDRLPAATRALAKRRREEIRSIIFAMKTTSDVRTIPAMLNRIRNHYESEVIQLKRGKPTLIDPLATTGDIRTATSALAGMPGTGYTSIPVRMANEYSTDFGVTKIGDIQNAKFADFVRRGDQYVFSPLFASDQKSALSGFDLDDKLINRTFTFKDASGKTRTAFKTSRDPKTIDQFVYTRARLDDAETLKGLLEDFGIETSLYEHLDRSARTKKIDETFVERFADDLRANTGMDLSVSEADKYLKQIDNLLNNKVQAFISADELHKMGLEPKQIQSVMRFFMHYGMDKTAKKIPTAERLQRSVRKGRITIEQAEAIVSKLQGIQDARLAATFGSSDAQIISENLLRFVAESKLGGLLPSLQGAVELPLFENTIVRQSASTLGRDAVVLHNGRPMTVQMAQNIPSERGNKYFTKGLARLFHRATVEEDELSRLIPIINGHLESIGSMERIETLQEASDFVNGDVDMFGLDKATRHQIGSSALNEYIFDVASTSDREVRDSVGSLINRTSAIYSLHDQIGALDETTSFGTIKPFGLIDTLSTRMSTGVIEASDLVDLIKLMVGSVELFGIDEIKQMLDEGKIDQQYYDSVMNVYSTIARAKGIGVNEVKKVANAEIVDAAYELTFQKFGIARALQRAGGVSADQMIGFDPLVAAERMGGQINVAGQKSRMIEGIRNLLQDPSAYGVSLNDPQIQNIREYADMLERMKNEEFIEEISLMRGTEAFQANAAMSIQQRRALETQQEFEAKSRALNARVEREIPPLPKKDFLEPVRRLFDERGFNELFEELNALPREDIRADRLANMLSMDVSRIIQALSLDESLDLTPERLLDLADTIEYLMSSRYGQRATRSVLSGTGPQEIPDLIIDLFSGARNRRIFAKNQRLNTFFDDVNNTFMKVFNSDEKTKLLGIGADEANEFITDLNNMTNELIVDSNTGAVTGPVPDNLTGVSTDEINTLRRFLRLRAGIDNLGDQADGPSAAETFNAAKRAFLYADAERELSRRAETTSIYGRAGLILQRIQDSTQLAEEVVDAGNITGTFQSFQDIPDPDAVQAGIDEETLNEIRRLAAVSAQEEAEPIVAQTGRSNYRRFFSSIREGAVGDLIRNKNFQIGAIATGALIAASFLYQSKGDRTASDVQGPPLMPGGNPYETAYPRMQPSINQIQQMDMTGSGTQYRINTYGSSQDIDRLRAMLGGVVDGPTNTTIYNGLPMMGKDPYSDVASRF